MSGYRHLSRLLAAAGTGLDLRRWMQVPDEEGPGASSRVAQAAAWSTDPALVEQAVWELSIARRALWAIADGDNAKALTILSEVLEAPLRPCPFEARLEELGARLATADDAVLAARFLERRQIYRQRFANGEALIGLSVLVGDPEAMDALAATLEPGVAAAAGWFTMDAAPGFDHPATDAADVLGRSPAPAPGFVPFAVGDEHDRPASANAYVVTVRHLEDARTATFAVYRVNWHELEGVDPAVSDLVLSFETPAAELLRRVDPERLRLRLFFGDGPAFDELSTTDRSLFDVEVNPPENRIYLKLRRPPVWSALGLPPAELWRHLHSCVLITEPG